MERTPRMLRNAAVARQAAAESMVLLKNVNNTLPLVPAGSDPLPVAVFGVGQIRTVKGGTGSGEVNSVGNLNILDGLTQCPALAPDELLARKYRTWCLEHKDQTKVNFLMPTVHHNEEMPLDGVDLAALAETCAAAILVIARTAGEGADMDYGPGSVALTDKETAMIRAVCAAFDKTILVLNTPGFIELHDVLPELSAALFIGLPGQEGGAALADVLTGEVPPSGHLSDTWPVLYADYANAAYYGGGAANGIEHKGMMGMQQQINVSYADDIYVGYRYFDTFGLEVQFPFGFGLTYGAPALASCAMGYAGGTVSVTATVENASQTYPCREVVQVYLSLPQGRLEQPYTKLAAFRKTGTLEPGGAETVKLEFDLADLAGYDEQAAAYVLEAGYYDVRLGFSCRDTQVVGSVYLPREITTWKLSNRIADLPTDFRRLSNQGARAITYPGEDRELEAAHKLAVRASDRDFITRETRYSGAFGGCKGNREDVTLYDVKNGDAKLFEVVARMTDEELCQMVCGTGMDMSAMHEMMAQGDGGAIIPPSEDGDFPMPDFSASARFDVPGAAGQTLALWETYRIPHLTLADGPAGVRLTSQIKNEDGEVVRRQICTAFPTGCLLACAWDPEVLMAVGDAVGQEMQEYRVDLWLAPGMNLHRNPLCGRNFEYYSEDPLLTGLCAAAITKGVQSHGGCGVTLKHFAGNNQEFQRDCSNDIVSERAMRELYLKSFEIAVRTAEPKAVMTSYNDIGGVPAANNYDLCTALLRDEWGFAGLVMTDWGGGISHPALSMWAGNDMIQPGGERSVELIRDALGHVVQNPGLRDFAVTITRPMLEQAVLHILQVVLASDAFTRRTREGGIR